MKVQKKIKKNIYRIWKNIGETPLEALEKFRSKMKYSPSVKMTYSGRLDPLAEGYIYILSHDAVHNKEEYNNKEKKYTVEVLLGFETDTCDLLGIVKPNQHYLQQDYKNINTGQLHHFIHKYMSAHVGTFLQKFPAYSSKPVNGKPLFQWAREGKIDEIEIPQHEVTVINCSLHPDIILKEGERIFSDIEKRIQMVKGDFRQEQIINKWKDNIDTQGYYALFTFEIETGPGFYVRQYVSDLSRFLSVPAVVFSICRTDLKT
jgi:tRNA pseudouridine(55) synthase